MVQRKVVRKRKPPLDRVRILRAAIALADDEGIGALSMRRLGQAVGVEAMSLYNHVENKDDILSGIVDTIVGDIDVAAAADTWQTSMRARAISLRELFARHPWAVGMLESRRTPGPAALRYFDAVLGVLRRAGFSPSMAVRACSVLDSYVYGYCLQEQSVSARPAEEAARETQAHLQNLPSDEYPYLAETAANVSTSGFDYAKEFEVGLDLLLEALERWRTSRSTT